MGMDIYSNSGVVFSLKDALPSIFRKVKKSEVKLVVQILRERWNAEDKGGLDGVKDKESLSSWMCSVADGLVKDGEYMDSLAFEDLFQIVVEAIGISLPAYSFDYWTRGRINGWDVPIGTPCIVFDVSELFETKMTKEGKRLAALLGTKEIQQSTWTIMSV